MSQTPLSPFEANPPTAKRLLFSVSLSVAVAIFVLVVAVLPAEYGIDLTGLGRALGLTQMSGAASAKKVALDDVLAGEEPIVTATPPATGEPLPLPNPAVHQSQSEPAKLQTFTIELPADGETEIKAVLPKGKMMLYSWKVDHDSIYVDFHGHDPSWADKTAFVRYEEKDGSAGANGSLVAPFTGEHGWYFLNTNGFPVVLTLNVQGYYDKLVDYGVKQQ